MATIDNLSIQVTANADSAARAFDRLASSAGGLRDAAVRAGGGMRDLAAGARDAGTATQQAGTQAGNAERHTRNYGRASEEAGNAAKRGTAGIATFWQALKRVAYYRFIRTIIKSITSAFKEGATNLYKWSQATGKSDFAKNLDRIATSINYLKNSIGAMLEPIVRILTPVIEWAIDGIVTIINWINKLFAALSGSPTYTVAKKVAKSWDGATESVEGTAKAIKRTILGFDEINKLDSQNSGYGGGSGSAQDLTEMFETRELDGWMKTLSTFISDFNLQIPATIAALLAGFEAVELAIKGIISLSLGWLKDMAGKTIDIAVSLVRAGWTTIKSWAISFGEALVDMAVRIKTSVVDLWTKLAAEWNALHPALQVGIVITTTALALWAAYQVAWALAPEKVLEFHAQFDKSAAQLKNDFVTAWNRLTAWYLSVKLRFEQTAAQMKNDLVAAWASLVAWSLGVSLALETKASQLKNDIVTAWNGLEDWFLRVNVYIATKASQLKNDLVTAWNKLEDWKLKADAMIYTKAQALWDGLKADWETVTDKILAVDVKLTKGWTSLKQWFIDNGEKIGDWALGIGIVTLGIAIAIATPWETLAAALTSLWADTTAGAGALTFGVSIGGTLKTTSEIATEIDNLKRPIQELLNGSPLSIPVELSFGGAEGGGGSPTGSAAGRWDGFTPYTIPLVVEPEFDWSGWDEEWKKLAARDKSVEFVVNLTQGWKGTLTDWLKGTSNMASLAFTFVANLMKGWNGTPQSALSLNNLVTNIKAALSQGWTGSPLTKLQLNGLRTTVTAALEQGWPVLMDPLSYLGVDGMSTSVKTSLQKTWKNPLKALGIDNLQTTVKADIKLKKKEFKVSMQMGGATKGTMTIMEKALGGIFNNGIWSSIPQYAGGTTNAHGSLFLAGEAGPEIVGHVGGRTEVLNKSQMASAMYSAVRSAMTGIHIDASMYGAFSGDNGGDDDFVEYIRQDNDAMRQQNELLRQQNELLRQLNEKEYGVSTTAINRANAYMNRRAGVTIAPVGAQ